MQEISHARSIAADITETEELEAEDYISNSGGTKGEREASLFYLAQQKLGGRKRREKSRQGQRQKKILMALELVVASIFGDLEWERLNACSQDFNALTLTFLCCAWCSSTLFVSLYCTLEDGSIPFHAPKKLHRDDRPTLHEVQMNVRERKTPARGSYRPPKNVISLSPFSLFFTVS